MLKKSSSILQELGLDKQVRAESRAALRSQASRSVQEAPRPLGRPIAAASSEAVCPGAKAAECTTVEAACETTSLSAHHAVAEATKVLAKTSEPTEAPSLPASASSRAVPVEPQKVEPSVVATQISRPVEAARQPTVSADKASAGEVADVGRRRPPALGAPELRPVAQAPATSEASLVRPVLRPPETDVAPPKPTGSATPVVGRGIVPKELAGLRWPPCFLEDPHGGRIDLTEGAARATRESGVGRGMCFLGPLQPADSGAVYFEIEVLELEAQRSQTIAIGFSTSLPVARPLLAERATDLGHGCFLVGYDLPKLFVHGDTAAKISARDWRPLKELCCGDCLGLLAARSASGGLDLTVYVNGNKKVSVPLPGIDESATNANALPWPGVEAVSDLYGVVDIHGAVRSVRMRRPPAGPLPPPSVSLHKSSVSRPLSTNSPPPTQGCATARPEPARGTSRALDRSSCSEAEAPARKRARLATFPDCNCTAHLRRSDDAIVHITSADFCIGRDTKVVSLALESEDAPNMVSRTHARIVSNDAGVQVIDCRSLNGTWLNSVKVANQLLRSGDTLVIGNPTQGPPEFRFTVELPSS